jgi:peptide/nickel transport system substrate-binding protein
MLRRHRAFGLLIAIGLVLTACTPPPQRGSETGAAAGPAAAPKKRLLAAIFSDPPGMHIHLTQPNVGSAPGVAELWEIMGSGLSYLDDDELVRPLLSEARPTAENGLWRVLSDGKMEMTWKIRQDAFWHDGMPVKADDAVFSLGFHQDREVGIVNPAPLRQIDAIDAVDDHTVLTRWSRPFIEADRLFTAGLAPLLPKHLLERQFTEDRANILNDPYWREGFVGTGPFMLQTWSIGNHMTLAANERYVLGRPKIDEIEARFMAGDLNTILASLLAGAIHILIGRGFTLDQALQLREITKDVNVNLGGKLGSTLPIFTQHINPQPAIVVNPEFRKAMFMAIDRQEMNDTLNYGLGQISHTWLQPDRFEYPGVEPKVVKYDFDPRRGTQIIEGLGYTRGANGMFQDANGTPLTLELWTSEQLAIQPKGAFSVSEYWRRLGVETTVNNVPNQRIPDREYRSQFPAFELVRTGLGPGSTALQNFRSSNTPLPENSFQGANRGRYRNPAFDALIEKYVTTIPIAERIAALGDIVHHQTENLIIMTLFFEPGVQVLGSTKLKNQTSNQVFNIHLWDLA